MTKSLDKFFSICHALYMPTRKKSPRKSTTASSSSQMSYETKIVFVVLLLLFVYPIGLIFMWVWMKDWPLWLKIVLSVPFCLAILAFFAGIFLIAAFIHHAVTSPGYEYHMKSYGQQYQQEQMMLTPTSTPSSTVSY